MTDPLKLTFRQAQANQPWTVSYSPQVMEASENTVPHILGSHCVLHAAKSLGKIAAVYETLDHTGKTPSDKDKAAIAAAAADLASAAIRFANLHGFDLATVLVERVREKNGIDFGH
jgi:hypothetical protein